MPRLSSRWRLLDRTVRMRLTLLQSGLSFVSGAVLIGITFLLALRFPGPLSLQPPAKGAVLGALGAPAKASLAQPELQRAADLRHFLMEAGIALAVMVALSIGLDWFIAGRMLRPLRAMTAATRQIFEDNLHERLALTGPRDELKDLGDTIDGLLSRLEAAFEAQRRFVANASHELRTPLTLERAMLEVALADPSATVASLRVTCQEVLLANEQQERLIEALLTLARGQCGIDHRRSLDLAAVTAGVLEPRYQDAAKDGVSLRAWLAPVRTAGDARLVERLVANLVDNALRYNVPGGSVEVRTASRAGLAVLSVTNTGPVVPADHIERLLRPFQRFTANRTDDHDGLGLGLSIVAAIAKAHQATLTLRPMTSGGLEVEVGFPGERIESKPGVESL